MKVILDTDFLINLLVPNESNHKSSLLMKKKVENAELIVLNLVAYEMATVLSRKFTQQFAIGILDDFLAIEKVLYYLSPDQERKAWQEFRKHSKKNISFVDCANLVTAQEFNCKIASFDKFYPKEISVAL